MPEADRHEWRTEAVREKQSLALKTQPTALRRCLRCEQFFHSTGPDHRLCNPCNGHPNRAGSRVGRRLDGSTRVPGDGW